MWHIIALISTVIGILLSSFKRILQAIHGLNDRQAIHPGIAEPVIYDRYNKFKKAVLFYERWHLFWLGLILGLLGPIIEVCLFFKNVPK